MLATSLCQARGSQWSCPFNIPQSERFCPFHQQEKTESPGQGFTPFRLGLREERLSPICGSRGRQ